MTAVFKNRLIGSAILMIAAIVFLPDLLDGQKQVNKDDFKAIPDRPEFAQVAEQQVFQRAQHDAARADAVALPVDNQPAVDGTTDPAPTQDALPDQQYASVSTDSKAAAPVNQTEQMVSAPTEQAKTASTSANTAEVGVQTPTTATVKNADAVTAAQPVVSKMPDATQTEVKAAPKPELKPEATLETKPTTKPLAQSAWVVKVGSFGKEQNANALVNKLREAGFATFSRKIVNSQGQTMISVVVGPDLQKDKLEKNLSKLKQLANISTLKVTAFSPAENN
jgi:DedD protein